METFCLICITKKKLTYVKGVNGEMIPSRDDYASFIRHFEEILTQENNPAKVVNTSTSGAYIAGITYMELADFVKNLKPQQININKELEAVFKETHDKWQKTNHEIHKAILNYKEEISELDKVSNQLFNEIKEIMELLEDPEKHPLNNSDKN